MCRVVDLVNDNDLDEFSIAIESAGSSSSSSTCGSAQVQSSNLSFGDVSSMESVIAGK